MTAPRRTLKSKCDRIADDRENRNQYATVIAKRQAVSVEDLKAGVATGIEEFEYWSIEEKHSKDDSWENVYVSPPAAFPSPVEDEEEGWDEDDEEIEEKADPILSNYIRHLSVYTTEESALLAVDRFRASALAQEKKLWERNQQYKQSRQTKRPDPMMLVEVNEFTDFVALRKRIAELQEQVKPQQEKRAATFRKKEFPKFRVVHTVSKAQIEVLDK